MKHFQNNCNITEISNANRLTDMLILMAKHLKYKEQKVFPVYFFFLYSISSGKKRAKELKKIKKKKKKTTYILLLYKFYNAPESVRWKIMNKNLVANAIKRIKAQQLFWIGINQ